VSVLLSTFAACSTGINLPQVDCAVAGTTTSIEPLINAVQQV
jgi:hypothetical protein